jgi:hypothetical protein
MDFASIPSLQGRSRRNAKSALRLIRRAQADGVEAAAAVAEAGVSGGTPGARESPKARLNLRPARPRARRE